VTDHGQAAYDVLRHVRPLHLQSARAVTTALQGEPVTMAIRALLERLVDTGPQTVPQIAAWLDVSRQAVQRVVDDAHTLGYVEVRENPAHRRSHLVDVTARGRSAFRRLHAGELATLAEVAAGIDRADLLTCAAVLQQLTDGIAERSRSGGGADVGQD
jgi:DNA-binding MarR family transcriptional regulator